MKNTTNITALAVLALLLACASGENNDDGLTFVSTATTGTPSVSSGSEPEPGSSGESGSSADGCPPGTPYCPCSDSMCFGDLVCNVDNICTPENPSATGGVDCETGQFGCQCGPNSVCSDGLSCDPTLQICLDGGGVVAECKSHYDCDPGMLCYATDPNLCGPSSWSDWSVSNQSYDINCYDGLGSCELLFYKFRFDWAADEWVSQNFSEIENLDASDWLAIEVWEEDLFSDDYIGGFAFEVMGGIEAWKNGGSSLLVTNDDGDSVTLAFAPI